MDLVLARLAGSTPPGREALLAALGRRDWLTHRPEDPQSPDGVFLFPGGGVYVVGRPVSQRPYTAPWLHVWLNNEARFAWIAPRLVELAGEEGLGLRDSLGCAWWPVPAPSELTAPHLARALALCGRCGIWEAWGLLSVALADEAGLELAESNPALAYALVSSTRLRWDEVPARERRALLQDVVRRPRRQILEAVGSPSTRSMQRLLAKIPVSRLSASAVAVLVQGGLPDAALRALRHLPLLGEGCLSLVAPPLWPHVGGRLLQEAARTDDLFEAVILRDCVEMARRMGRPEAVGIVHSREELKAIDRRLTGEYMQWQLHGAGVAEEAGPLRPPPLRGNDHVRPLTTTEDLVDEGQEMQSCVASYAPRVRSGECFVYRVLHPERATVAIRWDRWSRRWRVAQLRGPSNAPVQPETEKAVTRWLEGG